MRTMVTEIARPIGLAVLLVVGMTARDGRCGDETKKEVFLSEQRTNVFAEFKITQPAKLTLMIESNKEMAPKSKVVQGNALLWTQTVQGPYRHEWETLGPAQPNKPSDPYYVRVQGNWARPVGVGAAGAPPPDWFANAPQCDLVAPGVAEDEEESPGLVLKAGGNPVTVTSIAGPRNVGETIELQLPPNRSAQNILKVTLGGNPNPRYGTISPYDPTQSINIQPLTKTGTEEIKLLYEVSGEIYLSDTLAVSVVGDELQIVPAIDCLGAEEKTIWTYRGTQKVDSDWYVTFAGNGRVEVKKNGGWVEPASGAKVLSSEQSMTLRGTKTSSPVDDVEIEAKEGGETASEELTVLRVEQDHDLWWFNGVDPPGFHVEVTLTLVGNPTGPFSWQVVEGINKVVFQNNQTSITTTAPTVTVKSKSPSAAPKDVAILVRIQGQGGCTHRMDVRAPKYLLLFDEDTTAMALGWKTRLKYSIWDYFGEKVIQAELDWNETFGTEQDVITNNWPVPPETPGKTTFNAVVDDIWVNGAFNPQPVPPPNGPVSTTVVDKIPQEIRVGSQQKGKGVLVQSAKVVRLLDHAVIE